MNESAEEFSCSLNLQKRSQTQTRQNQEPDDTPECMRQCDSAQPERLCHAGHAGEWIEAEQLRQWVLRQIDSSRGSARHDEHSTSDASSEDSDIVFDLSDLDYLEASALQVLLAARDAVHRRGGRLRLVHLSPELREWFEFAGATTLVEECDIASDRQDRP